MKRSKTTALLLMSTAPLLFTACQRQQVQVQEGLYTSVESCVEAIGDPSACRIAFEQASQQAADAAPKYASRAECEQDYSADQCTEQRTSAGHSFVGPMMMGFFMSQMLNGNRAGLAQPPAAPAFRDKANGWARSEERRVGKECKSGVDLGGRRIIKKKKKHK
ncbi:MAG TPA: hypothetical protein DDZ67_11585, partial [Xanthomonadaceae bacterium]|nr:hypothetical protein [Xanthomonadaceae bacterium]